MINLALMGAGRIGKMHAEIITAHPEANLQFVYDVNKEFSSQVAKQNNAESVDSPEEAINNDKINAILIASATPTHTKFITMGAMAGKAVFCEKPIDLDINKVNECMNEIKGVNIPLQIGFNRRFSTHSQKIKSLVGNAPMNIVATMNAGSIPPDVWVHDIAVGGGRIIGEACHYLDLMVFLSGSKIKSVCMNALGDNPSENTDNASILVKMENGSTGVVNYFANGAKSYSKERLEVFSQGKILIMDNLYKLLVLCD